MPRDDPDPALQRRFPSPNVADAGARAAGFIPASMAQGLNVCRRVHQRRNVVALDAAQVEVAGMALPFHGDKIN